MLSVDLSIRDFDGQAVVALRGEFNLADIPCVASHLIAAVAACGPSVIVDLADLEGIGYSGLSVLLRVRKWTRRSGGDLPLAAPRQPVRRILEVTGLIDVFAVYHSVEEAANSARQARPRSPAVPRLLRPATVTRSGVRRPVCGTARHSLVQPLLLGAHQFIEALVWLWLQGHVPPGIGHVALWAYLLIAFVVLPVFVPLAVIAVEPTRRRKQMMAPFAVLGAVIAVTLFAAMARGPVGVKLAPYHLSYSVRVSDGLLVVALYVAVCGPLLVSGYRHVALFGVVNLVAVIVIARLTISGFASVWCGWAAVSGAAVTLHCRFARPHLLPE